MTFRIKIVVGAVLMSMLGYAGLRSYQYFFDESAPVVSLMGICEGGYYQGDISCSVVGKDNFKVAEVSAWLDGKPLVNRFRVNSAKFEHPFSIPSKALPNGKHVLKVEVVNGTYTRNKTTQEYTFFVDNVPLQAVFIKPELDHKVFQGRTLHLQFQSNKEIKQARALTLSKSFDFFPESHNSLVYECYIPMICEETPNEYMVNVEITDHVGTTLTLTAKFQVILFPFKKQTINIDPEKMKTEKEMSISNAILEKELQEICAQSGKQKLWQGTFCIPVEMTGTSTDFGTIRTSQEKGRYIHTGLDLLAAPKSVIWAPQDGIVVVKERYAYSGNTVVIDHGWGIFSLFFHLDSFADIAKGQRIKKGQPVGTLGKTGYASGYHLHWEMRVNNIPVDPMEWTKQTF